MYPIYERVSADKLFKNELGIIKRVLKELIKDEKLVLVNNVYTNEFCCLSIHFNVEIPIEYAGDITTYNDKDYCMIGVDLDGFRVNMKKFKVVAEIEFFMNLKNLLSSPRRYGYNTENLKSDHREVWEYIEKLGLDGRSSYSEKEVVDILQIISKEARPLDRYDIDSISRLSLSWVRGSNGLEIKNNDFMPVLVLDKLNYKLYYFDSRKFTTDMYYKKVKDLIRKEVLKEIEIDKISSSISELVNNNHLGSPRACLLKRFD